MSQAEEKLLQLRTQAASFEKIIGFFSENVPDVLYCQGPALSGCVAIAGRTPSSEKMITASAETHVLYPNTIKIIANTIESIFPRGKPI